MWIRFTADHDHRTPAFTIAYKAGWVGNVPHDIADAAVAAGKAARMRKVSKDAEPAYTHVDTREYIEDGVVKVERIGEAVFLKEADMTEGNGG